MPTTSEILSEYPEDLFERPALKFIKNARNNADMIKQLRVALAKVMEDASAIGTDQLNRRTKNISTDGVYPRNAFQTRHDKLRIVFTVENGVVSKILNIIWRKDSIFGGER